MTSLVSWKPAVETCRTPPTFGWLKPCLMKRRVFCRVRPVSTLAAEPQGAPSPRVSSLPCLETLRYDGAQSTTLATSQDSFDSEGKFGIPRFSGEPAQLPEYAFRVQMRMLREKGMEESELKKVGPLEVGWTSWTSPALSPAAEA